MDNLRNLFDSVKNDYRMNFEVKDEQLNVADAVLKNKHVLGLLPTGFGKTLCMVLPTILKKRENSITLIISPLTALMDDQIKIFSNWGLAAAKIEPLSQMDSVKINGLRLHTGKVAIVTGGAIGLGFEISKELVAKNVHVFIASSSSTEGKEAIEKIREDYPNAKVDFLELDLASLKSVKDFVENFISRGLPLHILINNAGVMFMPYHETEDNLEYHFQVNYLSHLYLTLWLLGKLQESGEDNSYARIINVSSVVQNVGCINLKWIGEKCTHWSQYSPHAAYADSKLAVVLSTYWLDSKLREDKSKVTVNALHPGIVKTNLYRYIHPSIKWLLDIVAMLTYKTPRQGADCILYLALSDTVEGQSGGYYDNSLAALSNGLSYNKNLQNELWAKSQEILQKIS